MHTVAKSKWATIETAYITGEDSVTFASLSAEHGIKAATIGKRAHRGKWTDRRRTYRQDVSEGVIKKTAEYAIDSMVELNKQDLKILDQYIAKGLRDIEEGGGVPAGSVLTAMGARRKIYAAIYGGEAIPDEVHEVAFKLIGVDVSKILALRKDK